MKPFYRFSCLLCHIASRSFTRMKTWGMENIPKDGGVILASNHQSYLDPVVAACAIPRDSRFLARSSLFSFAPFGWLIRALGAIPLARGGSDRAALRQASHLLRYGEALTLFPEGTRSDNGYLGEILSGVSSLAVRALVPVVPVYVHGTYDVWPRGRRLPRPGPVGVFYGRVIRSHLGHGPGRRERARRLTEEIQRALEELEQLAFELMPLRTRSAPPARSGPGPGGSAPNDPPCEAAGKEDGNLCEQCEATGQGSSGSPPGVTSNGQS